MRRAHGSTNIAALISKVFWERDQLGSTPADETLKTRVAGEVVKVIGKGGLGRKRKVGCHCLSKDVERRASLNWLGR